MHLLQTNHIHFTKNKEEEHEQKRRRREKNAQIAAPIN